MWGAILVLAESAVDTTRTGRLDANGKVALTATTGVQVATATAIVTAVVTGTPGCQPQWYAVDSQNVGTNDNELDRVDTISTNDVWAVGFYLAANGAHRARAHAPKPWQLQLEGNMSRDENAPAIRTLTQHWDGLMWSVVASPNVGEDDITCCRSMQWRPTTYGLWATTSTALASHRRLPSIGTA